MVICFRIGSVEHCYDIPVIEIPLPVHRPGPGPINYPPFIYDAVVLASVNAAAAKLTDGGVRSALEGGLHAALQALKKRAGEHVSKISF